MLTAGLFPRHTTALIVLLLLLTHKHAPKFNNNKKDYFRRNAFLIPCFIQSIKLSHNLYSSYYNKGLLPWQQCFFSVCVSNMF